MTEPPPGRTAAGFTLIELLVAFSLLGLIAVLSLGALQFGTRVWERTAASGEAGHRLQLAQDLIRRQLGRAVPKVRSRPDGGRKLFQGASDGLAFVAPLPGRGAAGGLYGQRLLLREDRLLLTWQALDGDRPEDRPTAGEAVILDGVAALEVAYLDPRDSAVGSPWRSDWTGRGLPPLVRLRLGYRRGTWPELLVRLPLANTGPRNEEG